MGGQHSEAGCGEHVGDSSRRESSHRELQIVGDCQGADAALAGSGPSLIQPVGFHLCQNTLKVTVLARGFPGSRRCEAGASGYGSRAQVPEKHFSFFRGIRVDGNR